MKLVAALCTCLLLAACGSGVEPEVETLRVEPADMVVSVSAFGQLRAVVSTPVLPPPGSRNPRTITWLAPNFSRVRKGEVVARFDTSRAEQGALSAGIELTKVDLRALAKQRELEQLLLQLTDEMELVQSEMRMADQFVAEDIQGYSRHEIIDAMRDRELLAYRYAYLESRRDAFRERQSAELGVLDARRAAQKSYNEEYRRLLASNEVRAPHDGIMILERTWWGQPLEVGSTAFPNNRIASIPNLEKMEAQLYVLETEALNLAPGQAVELFIDAFPKRPLTGTVTRISTAAAPIRVDSPVKYFTVSAALNEADPAWIKPAAQVRAEIQISRIEGAIAIPNQAVFQDDSGDWVMVRRGDRLVKREVSLGLQGPYRSQVLAGLDADDEVALYPPGDPG